MRNSVFAVWRSYENVAHVSWGAIPVRCASGQRTLSRILWKSKTLSPGNLQASHSRYHFFSRTGFPIKDTYFSLLRSFRGSKSPSSHMLLFVRTKVVRFGTERCSDGEIEDIRLLARRRVWSRLSKGRLPRARIELSVRSIASCWSYKTG